MTIEVRLRNGSVRHYSYQETWTLFLWSFRHYGGLNATNGFLAASEVLEMKPI